jgi:hypothetical protein
VPVLVVVGLFQLMLGALSGWAMLAKAVKPSLIDAIGIKDHDTVRKIHLDWIMMGTIDIAIGLALPGLQVWIVALLVFSTVMNPLLFLPPAINPSWGGTKLYMGTALLSFTCAGVGFVSAFITGLSRL